MTGEKVTGGVWDGSRFGDSIIITIGVDVGVGAATTGGLVLSSSQRLFLHTVFVELGFVHTLHTPQLSFLRQPSHSRHRFRLVRFGLPIPPPGRVDEGGKDNVLLMVGTPEPAEKLVGVWGTSFTRLGVTAVLSSRSGPLAVGVSSTWD